MKRTLIAVLLIGGSWLIATRHDLVRDPAPPSTSSQQSSPPATATTNEAEDVLASAFANQQSNLQVRARGIVRKVLADDNQGSRHQRFLVQVSSGQTLLIAHNIDLAPRIESLREGEHVAFYGEYEWNSKGGVIHWTHRDPQGRHPDGWLEHNGRRYQ